MNQAIVLAITLALSSPLLPFTTAQANNDLSPKQQLGKKLFFDKALSEPAGQACAGCHAPETGFTDPDNRAISPGVHPERFGSRNAPSVSYASYSPTFHLDPEEQIYVGGQFLDGRAPTLEAQAAGPFTNPVEMANPDLAMVVDKVKKAAYADLFIEVYGDDALKDEARAIQQITSAIADYERSREVNPFSSKFDAYLAGKAILSKQEIRGMQLYEAEDKGNCAACHPSELTDNGINPLFTDFTYDNLGVPKNPDNPIYDQPEPFNPAGKSYLDIGLGKTTGDKTRDGKFKVPTLRNIEITAPYMHNGVFKTLKEVVDFYNTRDTRKDWGAPEVAANVNTEELGDLKLTDQEVEDIVAFMKTLTDGYKPGQKY